MRAESADNLLRCHVCQHALKGNGLFASGLISLQLIEITLQGLTAHDLSASLLTFMSPPTGR